jgi:hypothetical protein
MRFWTREVAGWLLVIIGLYVFHKCYGLLTHPDHYFLEGSSLVLVGIIVFRGGIHLLKVAVAAQVCVQAQEDAAQQPARPGGAAARSSARAPLLTTRRFG